jgi:hypothetical protein
MSEDTDPATCAPSALDAVFVAGSTVILMQLAAGMLGISRSIGTMAAIGAMVATTTGAGGEQVQGAARLIMQPANLLLGALRDVAAPSFMLPPAPDTATPEIADNAQED